MGFAARLTDILPPEKDQAQHPLLLPFGGLGRLRLELAELLAVAQDDVHMLIERLKLPDEGPGVLDREILHNSSSTGYTRTTIQSKYLEDDPHSVVDMVLHFVVLADNHLENFVLSGKIQVYIIVS